MEAVPFRIIDANLNRIGEGLRVLEELARMVLNDATLTQQLKNLRHDIVRTDPAMQQRLVQARDSLGDIGAEMGVPGEGEQRGLTELVVANARRVQESLRVMEEIARMPGAGLNTDSFKRARFELYTIEKDLFSRLSRQEKAKRIRGLYVIIDSAMLRGRTHAEAALGAIKGGAAIVQLRDKELGKRDLLAAAQELKDLCAEKGVIFIMNDYLDIALAVEADGLHVGQDDLPVEVARRLLPRDRILGCSARTVEKAIAAQSAGADYVAVGAMYPTGSRENAEVVGPARLKQVKEAVDVPVVAIGGINRENLKQVLAAGADAAAVIGAVMGAGDIEEASRRLADGFKGGQFG